MDEQASEPPDQSNGSKALAKLLGQINIPTLLAILTMNGWSIGATNSGNAQREAQVDQAVREIHAIHQLIDEFESFHKQELANQQNILRELEALRASK